MEGGQEVLQTIVYRLFNEQLDPVPMPKGYGMEISPHLCRQVVLLEDGFSRNCCVDPCIVLNTIVSTQARFPKDNLVVCNKCKQALLLLVLFYGTRC